MAFVLFDTEKATSSNAMAHIPHRRLHQFLFFLLLISILLSISGCSVLLAKTGRYQKLMTNPISKENVHCHLGNPDLTGRMKPDSGWMGSVDYEVYYVHGPVYSVRDEICAKMGFGMLYGMWEIVAFPAELCQKLSACFVGSTVIFLYDPDGQIRYHNALWGHKSKDEIYPLSPSGF